MIGRLLDKMRLSLLRALLPKDEKLKEELAKLWLPRSPHSIWLGWDDVDMGGKRIRRVGTPVLDDDVARKKDVEQAGMPVGEAGDMIYHDGEKWTALKAPAAEKWLKHPGDGAAPEWADLPTTEPGLVLVDHDSGSGDITITGLDKDRIHLFFVWIRLESNGEIQFRARLDDPYNNHSWVRHYMLLSAGTVSHTVEGEQNQPQANLMYFEYHENYWLRALLEIVYFPFGVFDQAKGFSRGMQALYIGDTPDRRIRFYHCTFWDRTRLEPYDEVRITATAPITSYVYYLFKYMHP